MKYLIQFLNELYVLFIEMSPYLLLGMTVAGLLSVFIKKEMVAAHVGGHNLGSVFKAALLGVPLPLCSCGVIPTASYLKKYGASKPAVMSFLISTPQTGVDSLTATWGMLGPLFAVFRALTALITGLTGGAVSFLFDKEDNGSEPDNEGSPIKPVPSDVKGKIRHFLHFAYEESVDDIAINFIIGLAAAAIISLLIPDNFFEGTLLGGNFLSMLLMVVIGIPMYVCSTSSIPIAVALIAKGFSPGAAYVFLVAGPATNAATLAILTRLLGRKQTAFYLASIIGGSLIFGMLMNVITTLTGWEFAGHVMDHAMTFGFWDYALALLFAGLLLRSLYGRFFIRNSCSAEGCCQDNDEGESNMKENKSRTIGINGMNCNHCSATVKDALEAVPGTEEALVSLQSKSAVITGTASIEDLKKAVEKAGYEVTA